MRRSNDARSIVGPDGRHGVPASAAHRRDVRRRAGGRADLARRRPSAQPQRISHRGGRRPPPAHREDPGPSRDAPRPQRRAARGQHSARVGVGEPEEARRLPHEVAGARACARPRPGLHRARDGEPRRAGVRLPAPPCRAFHRRSRRRAGNAGGAPEARVPPLLPDGSGGQPCPRIHRNRRHGPGGPGARVRGDPVRRGRRQKGGQGPARKDRGEPRENSGPRDRAATSS